MDKWGQAAELKNILEMVLLPLSFLESSSVNRTLKQSRWSNPSALLATHDAKQ
ncbi:MAG: hypothetical protein WCE77_13670 [Priestia megaterium]